MSNGVCTYERDPQQYRNLAGETERDSIRGNVYVAGASGGTERGRGGV